VEDPQMNDREAVDQDEDVHWMNNLIVIGQALSFVYWFSFLTSMIHGWGVACMIAALILAYFTHHVMTLAVYFVCECCQLLPVPVPIGQSKSA
jgi:hypothetical protein